MLLGHLGVQPGALIVDPFAGSCVTGTAARAVGMSFAGMEAHPLIAELASLKLARPPADPARLRQAAAAVADAASTSPAASEEAADGLPDLVLRSFTPAVLGRLLTLRGLIREHDDQMWAPYMKWALLGTLRDVASVRVGWPYQRPNVSRQPRHTDPIVRFSRRAAMIAEDLARLPNLSPDGWQATIACGDSRDAGAWHACVPVAADGSVSSPPYLNNFDYADATRLELYFWGEVASWAEMCRVVRSGMIVATTQQSRLPNAEQALASLSCYQEVGAEIAGLTQRLAVERRRRSRGKEYDQVIPSYFLGISQILGNLATRIKPGAPAVWLIGDSAPYGVYVDTPAIIGRLAHEHGFSVETDMLLRHRGNRWAGNAARHQVKLSERLLLLRRAAPRSAD